MLAFFDSLVALTVIGVQTYYCSIANLLLQDFPFFFPLTENTIVVCSQEADNVVVISKPLTIAVWEICAGDLW